jgi:hypothetical protein
MATSIEILQEIRRDFAEITGILLYLQNLRQFSESQTKAIDNALEGFSFVQVQYIGEIRKSFGERLWYKLEDVDKPEMDEEKNRTNYGIHSKSIIDRIKESARELNKKLLLLPGDKGCSDDQSKQIEKLFEGLKTWRIEHLKQLEISFA